MKGHDQVIELLNEVLTGELTAVNQYFLHAKMCKNWGYERLAHKIYKESIDEMRHADELVERILYLEGLPNLQRLGKIQVGQTVVEALRSDLGVEARTVELLNRGVALCRDLGDNGSRELLVKLLVASEEHHDWLHSQLNLVDQVGEPLYLSQQIHKDD